MSEHDFSGELPTGGAAQVLPPEILSDKESGTDTSDMVDIDAESAGKAESALTVENDLPRERGLVLSEREAAEYCEFKRRKRIAEVRAAMSKAEIVPTAMHGDKAELKQLAESAIAVSAAAVRVPAGAISEIRAFLKSKKPAYGKELELQNSGGRVEMNAKRSPDDQPKGIFSGGVGTSYSFTHSREGGCPYVDCIVGVGRTLPKVKAYETKCAVRSGAKEITLIPDYLALKSGRTGELKREIGKVCHKAKKCIVKVQADKSLTLTEILRLAKIASEAGAKYISVPFGEGCTGLKRQLHDSCMLEVTGADTVADYKAMIAAGVERIGTSRAEEIYAELIEEAERDACIYDYGIGKYPEYNMMPRS